MKKNDQQQKMLWMPVCMSIGIGCGLEAGAVIDRRGDKEEK